MVALTREDLDKITRPTTTLEVPEFGGEVRFAKISALDVVEHHRRNLQREIGETTPDDVQRYEAMCDMIELCLVDDNGDRIFGSGEFADFVRRAVTDLDVVNRLFVAAADMNGMTDAATESAEKNSEAA